MTTPVDKCEEKDEAKQDPSVERQVPFVNPLPGLDWLLAYWNGKPVHGWDR